MSKIQLLDKVTIDKIAAGEVIERPAAVVKELVENAIDAGAKNITIEIKDGGIAFIRITDDGCGIEKNDIKKAFLRHSTSKIRHIEDLSSILSLGFRGEALSSISSVAQVELLTKCQGENIGNKYVIHGGTEIEFSEVAVNEGTTFIIRQIFYNIPARKKFLKTPSTEGSHVGEIITRLAMSHPNISFKFISNGVTKLQSTGNGSLKEMIYAIYGRDIASNLLELNVTTSNVKMTGYIGKPSVSRGNRNYENYFINGRYIKSGLISKAIEDGYKGYTMQHRYPFVVLHIELNTNEVDINVHPTKMDLRFTQQNTVYNHILNGIIETLSEPNKIIPKFELPDAVIPENKNVTKNPPLSEVNNSLQESERPKDNQGIPITKDSSTISKPHINTNRYGCSLTKEEHQENLGYFMDKMKDRVGSYHNKMSSAEITGKSDIYKIYEKIQVNKINEAVNYALNAKEEQITLFDQMGTETIPIEYKLIGQVFDTYWMVEFKEQLYIIDQHAAHEKVLYENIVKELENKEFTSQSVSPPTILTVTMAEKELLLKNMNYFTKIGFVIEEFGIDTYAIRAVPGNLHGINSNSLFLEMLDDLSNISFGNQPAERITEKIASVSCKAAVKGNSVLSRSEIDSLIRDLLQLENPFHCPHGRPVIINMTKKDMEKKFKRII